MEKNADQAALISADILRMIFLLLPRKSILMLQLVCKYWYHIVSDPLFIRNYRAKHTSLFGFFYPTSLVPPIAFIPFSQTATLFTQVACIGGTIVPPNHHITLLDSCNGLLICHFFKLSGPNAGTSAYIVCNPITWQQSRLPPPPVLAGEPKTFLVHGFVSGALSSTCPFFEVIRVLRSGRKGLVVSKFSSKTQKWTWKNHVANFLEEWYIELTGMGILCNGSIHWLCLPIGLVAYDVRTEHFSVMKVPEDDGGLLKESEGCLLYVRIKREDKFWVWVLEDYSGMKWCLRYSIKFNKLPREMVLLKDENNDDFYSYIVAFDPVDAGVVFLKIGNKIVLYRLQSCEAKEVCDLRLMEEARIGIVCPFKMPKSPINWISSASYSKILFSPKRGQNLREHVWDLIV